ncbi:MAG TPA: DNA recombination protein RmuC [Acidimicrobiia bacterium]|jgi:DNA recombination protein RmuC|nr:DNA recombination protein RmuC [Acidimicrobiia bacterium]
MDTQTIALVIAMTSAAAVIGLMILLLVAGRRQTRSDESAPDLGSRFDELQIAIASREGALGAQVAQIDSKLAILQESVTGREASLDQQVRGIGTQMQGITALFTNDRARGGWAEIGMKRIFEHGGLVEGRDYTCQVSHGEIRPDAVVHLPGGRNLVIDAKFPTARFAEALAEEDPDRRTRLLIEQGKDLERIGKGLAAKGYAELASGGYVVMYLPSQAVYEAAAAAHPDLIDRLMASRVIIAGPSALFALLLNVGSLLTEFRALQQADQILEDARELRRRMTGFVDHMQRVGAGLTGAVRAFNSAVGSWESRLSPQLNRMSEQSGGGEIVGPTPVEEAVRETQDAGLRVAG